MGCDPQRLAAATNRRALIYSRAGHGFSDVPDTPRTPRFMHDEALDVLPRLLAEHKIDRPVLVRYVEFLGRIASGDLGTSTRFKVPVKDIIWSRLANTAFLAKAALLALALANVGLQHANRHFALAVAGGEVRMTVRVVALASMLLWLAVLVAGRWIAFV